MLFNFGVELQIAKSLNAGSLTLRQGDRSLVTCRLLALEKQTDLDAFLVVSLDTLHSTYFCWSSSLLFGKELDYWSSHR